MTTFKAWLQDAAAGEQNIGSLELAPGGELALLSAAAGKEAFLSDLVERINALPGIDVDVPPPAEARRFARYTRKVDRADAGFGDALTGFLGTYYGLRLEADAAEADGVSLDAGSVAEVGDSGPAKKPRGEDASGGVRRVTTADVEAGGLSESPVVGTDGKPGLDDEDDVEPEAAAPVPPLERPAVVPEQPDPVMPIESKGLSSPLA